MVEKIKWEKEFLNEIKNNGVSWSTTDIYNYINLYKKYKIEDSEMTFLSWLKSLNPSN